MRRPLARLAPTAALILLAPALAGCADGDSGLPRVTGTTVDAAPASAGSTDYAAIAQAMYSCLKAEDIPVQFDMGPNGQQSLITFDQTRSVLWSFADGYVQSTPSAADLAAAKNEEQDQAVNGDPTKATVGSPLLEVDGVDYSDLWAGCLASTGYDPDAPWTDFDVEALVTEVNRATVEASNAWAKCARENGFPTVIDAVMPTDNTSFSTVAALLPASITEEELRQLLAVCPNFDPAIEEKNEALSEDPDAYVPGQTLPEGFTYQPSIGFDYPDFDCEDSRTENPTGEVARLLELCDILDEPLMEYMLAKG